MYELGWTYFLTSWTLLNNLINKLHSYHLHLVQILKPWCMFGHLASTQHCRGSWAICIYVYQVRDTLKPSACLCLTCPKHFCMHVLVMLKGRKKNTFNFKYVFRYFNNCFFKIKTYKKNYHGIFTILHSNFSKITMLSSIVFMFISISTSLCRCVYFPFFLFLEIVYNITSILYAITILYRKRSLYEIHPYANEILYIYCIKPYTMGFFSF